jgi:hypothetical protein
MMQLRAGCEGMETVRCGNLAIVCQVNKLRLLERNHPRKKFKSLDMQLLIHAIRMTS